MNLSRSSFRKAPGDAVARAMRLASSIFLVTMFLAPALLFGQRTTASLSGTVTDPSGGVVPNAQVSAISATTGAVSTVRSNAQGFYVVPNLAAGTYRLKVAAAGFQTDLEEGIVLRVGQDATLPVALRVGTQSQTVEVKAASTQVDLRSQTLGEVVSPEMAVELPLNGRNVLQLMTVTPDVSPAPGGQNDQYDVRPGQANIYVSSSGSRSTDTTLYLDGGVNEDPYTYSPGATAFPNPDAIEEFTFETNSYDVRFGARGGGVVNAITRGGTNQFHGTAFEFVRNSDINATNFFTPGTPDGLKRNQYGFSVGGPIQKDKTFFFLSWQGTNLRQTPANLTAVTPTQSERNGDFSAVSTQLVNPATGLNYQGNQINPSTFNPVAQNFLKMLPVGAVGSGLVRYSAQLNQNDAQWVARGDHQFGNKFRLSGSYLYDKLNEPSGFNPNNILTANYTTAPDESWGSQHAALNLTYTVAPNLLTTLTATVARTVTLLQAPPGAPSFTSLGSSVVNMVPGNVGTMAMYVGSDWATAYFGRTLSPGTVYDSANNWTWIKGKHTVQFGGELLRGQHTFSSDFYSDGFFYFLGNRSGNAEADFMLGAPFEYVQDTYLYFSQRQFLPALYLGDTYKMTRRLTWNLGVRWNPQTPWTDIIAHQCVIFSQQLYNEKVVSKRFPNLPPGLLAGGDPGVPDSCYKPAWGIFEPRVGFAYDVFGDGKTSVRGGYGLYHGQFVAVTENRQVTSPPYSVESVLIDPTSFSNPWSTASPDPYPVTIPPSSSTVWPEPFFSVAYSPNMKFATIQQWNITVEHQLPASMLLRLSYEGTESYHLNGGVEANPATYVPGQSTLANVNQFRPDPQFTNIALNESIGTASYNALTITAQKRLSHGLTFLTGFRWAKSLDENSTSIFQQDDYNTTDIRLDRGLSDFDVPRQFTASYVYQLPTLRSKGLAMREALGGWQTSGILSIRSNFPYTCASGLNYSYNGIGGDRCEIVGNPNLSGGRPLGTQLNEWFNTAAFNYNTPGTIGNSARNFLFGPSQSDFDFAMIKSFPFKIKGDESRIDFRAEFFNLFNHPTFADPVSTLTSTTTFGQIISTTGNPRVLQFALKLYF